ncbi:MAG: hypothetical protein AAGE13_15955 [Pseudomonadota bacterium]
MTVEFAGDYAAGDAGSVESANVVALIDPSARQSRGFLAQVYQVLRDIVVVNLAVGLGRPKLLYRMSRMAGRAAVFAILVGTRRRFAGTAGNRIVLHAVGRGAAS